MTHVRSLLELFEVAPVTRLVLTEAMASRFHDFEDAVLHAAAREAMVDAIATRNVRDFRASAIPVLTPDQLLHRLRGGEAPSAER